jgi:TolB protein
MVETSGPILLSSIRGGASAMPARRSVFLLFCCICLLAGVAASAVPAAAAAGGKIVFSVVTRRVDIYSMNADGSDRKMLTTAARDGNVRDPSISPDGRKIVFTKDDGAIFTMNVDGGDMTKVTDAPGRDQQPSFSADGKRFVFAGNRGDERHIFVIDADGSHERQLTHGSGQDANPVFSPDGRRIAFERFEGKKIDIFSMDSDGRDLRSLTGWSRMEVANPAYSPDGKTIVFQEPVGFHNEIFAMDARTGEDKTNLTKGAAGEEPSFSPNGDKIVYRLLDGIFTMNADGSDRKQITQTTKGNREWHPTWGS